MGSDRGSAVAFRSILPTSAPSAPPRARIGAFPAPAPTGALLAGVVALDCDARRSRRAFASAAPASCRRSAPRRFPSAPPALILDSAASRFAPRSASPFGSWRSRASALGSPPLLRDTRRSRRALASAAPASRRRAALCRIPPRLPRPFSPRRASCALPYVPARGRASAPPVCTVTVKTTSPSSVSRLVWSLSLLPPLGVFFD